MRQLHGSRQERDRPRRGCSGSRRAGVGRRIEVAADLERVRAFCDGRVVADHERIWARHQTLTDPAHWAAAQALRRQRFTVVRPAAEPEVQIRCLADYDAALGLDGGIA